MRLAVYLRLMATLVFVVGSTLPSAQAFVCDVDGDQDIDKTDITSIFAARGTRVPAGDARDADGDGVVTVADSRACTLRCSRAACAVPPPNRAPRADAGADRTVRVGDLVTLTGAGSSDADGDPLSYRWTLGERPSGSAATLDDPQSVTPRLRVDRAGDYVLSLVVSDGRLESAPDSVRISTGNVAPRAAAGPDQRVAIGARARLDGTASSDDDGDVLSWQWRLVSRPNASAAVIEDDTLPQAGLVPDLPGRYEAELIVSDGRLASAPDTVVITTTNVTPVASAGLDQTVRTGQTVELDGSGSSDADGQPLAYFWTLLSRPPGSAAALDDRSSVAPRFVADRFGGYVAQLVVNDGQVDSAADTVVISTANTAPQADAGNDRTVQVGVAELLDGSGSTDVDGQPLQWRWALLSRPADSAAVLADAASMVARLTPDMPGTYVVQLIVSDGLVDSVADTVVLSTRNLAPVAHAGADQSVVAGARVQLDGSASADPEGSTLSWRWTLVARPLASLAALERATSATPGFVADRDGTYVLQLVVNDGELDSAPDQVIVSSGNLAPVADAGADRTVPVGGTVQLDGSASRDADGHPLSWRWSLLARPSGSNAALSATDTAFPELQPDLAGDYLVQLIVNDGYADSVPDTVRVQAESANRAPQAQIAGGDRTVTVAAELQLDGGASVDPDGDPLTYLWRLASAPAGSASALADPDRPVARLTPDMAGEYRVELVVSDGQASSAPAAVTLLARAPNLPPDGVADVYRTDEGVLLSVDAPGVLGNDSDANGDALRAELVTPPASGALTLRPDGSFTYQPQAGFAGVDRFRYRPRDAAAAGAEVEVELAVAPGLDVLPLDLQLSVSPQSVPAGGAVTVTVASQGGRAPVSRSLQVDGATVALDAAGRALIPDVAAGVHRVVATVSDAQGSVTREGFFSGQVAGDAAAPTVAITAPLADAELFASVDVVGTASDANLAEYRLAWAPSGTSAFTEFARGTSPVVGAVLGRFDITTLGNGLYDLRLTATDANGATSSVLRTVGVVGDDKVANFSVSFEDLSLEASGIPVVVSRTYSTLRRAERLDFGYGWSVDYQNARVQTNGAVGRDTPLRREGGIFGNWCLRATGKRVVSVTLPDGAVERFDFVPEPQCQALVPPSTVTPRFVARAGTRSTLTTADPGLLVAGGAIIDSGTGGPFDPDSFTLTTADNTVYELDRNFGIRSVRDPAGNVLTYSAAGIVHSGGASVSFARDGQGRITRVTDPAGQSIEYAYNANGDLASVTDRSGAVSRMRYNRTHGLLDFTDPRGVMLMRNVYDDAGRLIEQIDAAGNRVAITTDTAAQRQTVRDRRGFATTYAYDASGNVTEQVDPLGGVTRFAYDARGNETVVTDPLGRVTSRVFSSDDRVTEEADPLGNTTRYAYNSNGAPTELRDALGRVTTLAYTASGNPAQIVDAAGQVTALAYDGRGNLTQLTDPSGAVTRYAYDAQGRRIEETAADGTVTRMVLDANGNETERSFVRGTDTIRIRRVFDANGRVTEETDAEGQVSRTEWNALGRETRRIDPLGRETRYEYDARGNLIRTVHPDGSSTRSEFDANGNETARIDRRGGRTTFVYDALNRLVETVLPDGARSTRSYDAAGQLVEETDALGRSTRYGYDAAGRLIQRTDAAGNTAATAFDAVGNVVAVTDAAGNVTTYEYDAANRRVLSRLPDGTELRVSYDATGRKTSETDAAGNITRFEWDAMGRLVAVTAPLGGITRYTYDAQGNKLTQTDAAGRTTRWTYDRAGRVTSRTLPLGQTERFAYDAAGQRTAHTDFRGRTTAFEYDAEGRIVRKTRADGVSTTWTWTASGRPAVITDARGSTRYTWDARDRLIRQDNPDGSSLRYAYDAAGNRTEMAVQHGAGPERITRWTHDPLDRPATLTDPEGGVTTWTYDANGNRATQVLPNGVRAEYTWDTLNRLTRLRHVRVADNTELARFDYTLSATGQRVRAEEVVAGRSRTVDYSYDAYSRLVQEQIADPFAGDRNASYTYDAVGNRIERTVNGVLTRYRYDDNDRLLDETTGSDVSAWSYDENGQTLTRRLNGSVVAAFSWDDDGRLAGATEGATTVAYTYDADGNRVSRTVGGSTTHFIVDSQRDYAEVVEERTAAGALVVAYVHGDELLKQLRGGQGTYYHADGVGSVRALTDAAGTVTDTWTYEAFGMPVGRTGANTSSFGFQGEYTDPVTGWLHLRSRDMIPDLGRFASMDSFAGFLSHPLSLNKYVFAEDDPVNRTDPSGHFSMGSVMSGINISFTLMNYATTAIGLFDMVVGGERAFEAPEGRFTLWDALFAQSIRAVAGAVSLSPAASAAAPPLLGPAERHHTVPVYVCGATSQTLVPLRPADHRRLHRELYAFDAAANIAGWAVDRLIFKRPLRATVTRPVQRLARNRTGRGAIGAALGVFYELGGWWGYGSGALTIGSVFPVESARFVAGHHSWPGCKR